jgi:hypothetical protein
MHITTIIIDRHSCISIISTSTSMRAILRYILTGIRTNPCTPGWNRYDDGWDVEKHHIICQQRRLLCWCGLCHSVEMCWPSDEGKTANNCNEWSTSYIVKETKDILFLSISFRLIFFNSMILCLPCYHYYILIIISCYVE